MTFDKDLASAELASFEILVSHHVRQMRLVRDRTTLLLFATKLGALKGIVEHAAMEIKRERICGCGAIIEKAVQVCPSCGRDIQ